MSELSGVFAQALRTSAVHASSVGVLLKLSRTKNFMPEFLGCVLKCLAAEPQAASERVLRFVAEFVCRKSEAEANGTLLTQFLDWTLPKSEASSRNVRYHVCKLVGFILHNKTSVLSRLRFVIFVFALCFLRFRGVFHSHDSLTRF
jgi:hypothetical protein